MKKPRLAFALLAVLLVALAAAGTAHAFASTGEGPNVTFVNDNFANSSYGAVAGGGAEASPQDRPTCPTADRLIQVPAVVGGQEGGLLDLDVSVAPGNGSIFSTVSPTVGLSTQQSEQQAVTEAFANLSVNREDCDVAFALENDGSSGGVDGPSAGLAMTVALRAALTGKEIRPDVIITGAILPGGRVGDVGGLIDKAQAASRGGKHIFITSRQQLYESIVLHNLGRQYNFSTVQVKTLRQAFDIATSPPGQIFNDSVVLANRPVPANLTARSQTEEDKLFGQVALAINAQLEKEVAAGATGPLAPYQQYFQTEIAQNRRLVELGYSYTSANNAFLSETDADFLSTPARSLDVGGEMGAVGDCLSRLPAVAATDRNYEWVAGANARQAWAAQKVQDIRESQAGADGSSEEKYAAVRELYYARSWCEAAGYMLKEAKTLGGRPMDAARLEAQARADVKRAGTAGGDIGQSDADAQWHLKVANASLENGDWLAAIYDAAYSSGAQQAVAEESNAGERNLTNLTNELAAAPMQTLWGRTYQSQGIYGQAASRQSGGNGSDAHLVLRLAAAMEDGMGRAGAQVQNSGVNVQVGGAPAGGNGAGAQAQRAANLIVLGFALIGIVALAVSVARRMGGRKKKKQSR